MIIVHNEMVYFVELSILLDLLYMLMIRKQYRDSNRCYPPKDAFTSSDFSVVIER